MKICFNGWYSGFLDKTNPTHIQFFLDLFSSVYNEACEIGSINDSDVLCEFDMLLDCPGTLINHKKWKQTYLFNGESTMKCNPNLYDVVLWGERNYKNVVNVPLFIPYIYSNNFVEKLTETKKITNIPEKDVCVIISNPGGGVRNHFLNELDKTFNVTYAGSYKNNIGQNIPFSYNTPEFLNFVSQFKFIISMENSRNDTYITEKITHGLIANTVPVYWGSTRVYDYFNNDRILCLEDETCITETINKMKELMQNPNKWLEKVNQPNFINNKLQRNIDDVAKDIRCLINKGCWNHITHIHCVNNPEFEPERNSMLKNMFKGQNINGDFIKYISPTYKHTISQEQYNKYTSKQLVRHLRSSNLTYSELSLFLNYKAVLEDIEKNYKDGLFLIFESDVLISKEIHNLNRFLDFIKDKKFDLIHLGICDEGVFKPSLFTQMITGYRNYNDNFNKNLINYISNNCKNGNLCIEDITTSADEFRVLRKFYTRCCDSFLWTYQGIVKFLHFMRQFEDYSSPFDYYMCNFFETNLDFKHYWTANEFFIQGSNLGIIKSTLRC
jgi:hypothetical protein